MVAGGIGYNGVVIFFFWYHVCVDLFLWDLFYFSWPHTCHTLPHASSTGKQRSSTRKQSKLRCSIARPDLQTAGMQELHQGTSHVRAVSVFALEMHSKTPLNMQRQAAKRQEFS